MVLSCCRFPESYSDNDWDGKIVFGVEESPRFYTKAEEITSLSSFYVSAVKGSPGSETCKFNSCSFTQVMGSDPVCYASDQLWPAFDESWKFYASNVPMVSSAAGTQVSASNDTDVLVAYLPDGSFKSKNILSFQHVFARLGTISVISEVGMTISDVDIRLTPKTGGTYNIRTGVWDNVSEGSVTCIANKVGENVNDLWLVPGTYTLTASWTCIQDGGSVVSYTDKESTIELVAGEVTSAGCVLGGSITCGVDIDLFQDNEYVTNYEPLTFIACEDGDIIWKTSRASWVKTIEYSKDNGSTWTSVTSTVSGARIPVRNGDKVLIRGNNLAYANSKGDFCSFSRSIKYQVYGSLGDLMPKGFRGRMSKYGFKKLFYNNSLVTNYPGAEIILPAIVLDEGCYEQMFYSTLLKVAPDLPATILAESCYANMFAFCQSLIVAPELPATTLVKNCYGNMFYYCMTLTVVPDLLPATTLAENCYGNMFAYCRLLIKAPELPATTLAENCYKDMFCYCTSLKVAPELPATTLAQSCYNQMFYCCYKLNYVKCLATDISASNCTTEWLSNVASSGTFVKSEAMNDWTTDSSGVPSGWTIVSE